MNITANKLKLFDQRIIVPNSTSTMLAEVAIILFFAQPFLTWVLGFAFGRYSGYIMLLLPYVPVVLYFLVRQGRGFPYDFFVLLALLLLFFLVTYIIHPNYGSVYRREYYGIWDYVIKPTNGLYAYLFLRLIDDPKRILKCLRISAVMAYVYYAYTLYKAIRVGYWELNWDGEILRTSYSLEFGYDLLLYVLVFLYCAFKYKRMTDWVMGAAGVFMIMGAGSRGPILDIIIFVALYIFLEFENRKYKIVYGIALLILAAGILLFYVPLLNFLSGLMERFGLQSRFIRKMLSGDVADDNGRAQIWQHAIRMIKSNPLGYGAMGSRHEIIKTIFVGHPHNIFLEFMIDYGVILGPLLLIMGGITVIRCLKAPIEDEWKGLVIIFVGLSSQLLVSGTYWHRQGIWGLLAIIMGIKFSHPFARGHIRLKL